MPERFVAQPCMLLQPTLQNASPNKLTARTVDSQRNRRMKCLRRKTLGLSSVQINSGKFKQGGKAGTAGHRRKGCERKVALASDRGRKGAGNIARSVGT